MIVEVAASTIQGRLCAGGWTPQSWSVLRDDSEDDLANLSDNWHCLVKLYFLVQRDGWTEEEIRGEEERGPGREVEDVEEEDVVEEDDVVDDEEEEEDVADDDEEKADNLSTSLRREAVEEEGRLWERGARRLRQKSEISENRFKALNFRSDAKHARPMKED